jgi:hypothetical protein
MAKLIFGLLMAKIYNLRSSKNNRLYIAYSLLFFLMVVLSACRKHASSVTLIWKDQRAIGIQIPQYLIGNITDSVKQSLKIELANTKDKQGILGDLTLNDDVVLFTPLIPLSPGLTYLIFQNGKQIGQIQIPGNTNEERPALISIYPEQDTVPENLLKIYLRFSKPMRTGLSLSHVYILNGSNDTMRNVFLNLQPELWDTAGKVLTLWLDPGRIKRGLVLNKKLGNPLKKSETYRLVVSSLWKDTHGLPLKKNYTKQFAAGGRDEQIPDINSWQFNSPKVSTTLPFIIDTHVALDHYLLQESIQIIADNGNVIKGRSKVNAKDNQWQFTPVEPWKAQHYKIKVNSRLEDLAGNNLNRVFDRDLTKDKQKDQAYYERSFELK